MTKLVHLAGKRPRTSLYSSRMARDPDPDPSAVYDRIHAKYLGVDMHDAAV